VGTGQLGQRAEELVTCRAVLVSACCSETYIGLVNDALAYSPHLQETSNFKGLHCNSIAAVLYFAFCYDQGIVEQQDLRPRKEAFKSTELVL